MANDNTINRQSLNTDLATRYATQKVGGAYDAKKPTPDIFGIQEKFWTKPGFPLGEQENLGTGGSKKIEQSLYRQGFNNTKYKG
jgi:hypothetical protein